MKLSLNIRIFAILSVIMAASLLVIWLVLCPKYEALAVGERTTEMQRLQICAVQYLDRAIMDWSHDTEIIAAQVAERPKEGEAVLRTMMALRPDIIQIKIRSMSLSDELVSQNTMYPALSVQVSDSAWIPSKLDSMSRFAWLSRSEPPKQLFAVQRQFSVQNLPFVLTVFLDAKRLNDIFTEMPMGREYSAGIVSPSSILIHDTTSSLNLDELMYTMDRKKEIQRITEEEASWLVLTKPLPSVRLWLVIAIPEKIAAGPVKDLMLYSTSLVIGLTIILLILGWLLAHQARRSGHKREPAAEGGGNR